MRKLPTLLVWFPAVLAALSVSMSARGASVGPAGYTNDFSAQPAAADWSMFSIAGGQAEVTTPAQVDTDVQLVAASSIISQTVLNANTPADANAGATWSSSGFYLQTRPTGNRITLLMCTLVNNLGAAARGVTISYDYFSVAPNGDEILGHNTYYSLTGAAGSWTPIPALTSVSTGGRLTADLSFTWPNGSPLYILWADDNSINSPDTANQIDSFSAIATPGTQTPVTITTQPQSQTVNELEPVTFTVGLSGYLPPTLQYYTNNVPVPGATNTTYLVTEAPLHFDGLQFKVIAQNVASNITYYATSSVATLTVNADLVAPVLAGAASVGLDQIVASFSERLSPASVGNLGNYSIIGPGGVTVSGAVLDATGTNLLLTVSTMVQNADYTLTVSGVRDRSAAGNLLAPSSQAPFKALSYASVDIGNPAILGSASVQSGTFTATGAGTNIAGAADQFFFYYQTVAGNFDLRTRVENLTVADLYTKAGLMARETIAANSRFAMAVATPSSAGAYLLSRSTIGGNASAVGGLPVNYPQTWLRLTRSNTVFTAYASFDGETWASLGSVTLASAASTFNVGLAINSANASQAATARFQDFGNASGGTFVSDLTLPWEPMGPATRNTGLVISEIMYHPKHSNDLEFVEIFNAGLIAEDMSGYRLAGNVDYTFANNTILPAGGFLVVARNPVLLQQAYGITGVLGPWVGAETNALPDGAGQVRLRYRHLNALLLEVNYATESPWPLAADGVGHSLVLARPSYGQDSVKAWAASERIGGSPGRMETVAAEPLRNVVINEFLANSDAPAEDYIELYNYSTQPVDLFGAYLSDDRDTNKFRIANHVILPARGFAAFTQTTLGFALSSGGERIYLVNSNQTRVIDVIAFAAQAAGVASGRSPDGAPGFHELAAQTPGTTNSPLWIRDIVINEIMFNPPSGNDDDQFVELYNRSTNAVNLGGWRFADGIDYSFPSNVVLAGHEYLVLARNTSRFLGRYPELSPARVLGNFSGRLGHGGERIALAMPEYIFTTNGQGVVSTTVNWIPVDEVSYVDSGRWAQWADGDGSSLELIDPDSDNRLAANWADSDETGKSVWTNVIHSAILDNVYPISSGAAMDEVQVMILGAGEALMDDVEVRSGTSTLNLVINPTFNSGLTNWLIQGNHERSGLEPVGPNNASQCLRIRATAGGDNGANRVECDLSSALAANINATIAGRFRWLRGFPIVLMRVHGGGIEAVGTLPIPANLGTPGQSNSRLVGNAGPAVYEVSHSPVLPAANQAVVVSARVSDPDGIASAQLRYRLDPATNLTTLVLRDDGTSGDAVAGDGLYSATIPGQASGTLVAFHIAASDTRTPAGATFFPVDAPKHECLIRFGDPAVPGMLGVYRLWQTTSNYNRWSNRERLSNEPVDGTFIYGKLRSIYNAGTRYRGSPFTRNPGSPVATGANFVWSLPDDDQLLGTDELNIDSLEPTGRDATALREVTSFTMADQLGLPFSYQRYIRPVINGTPTPSPVSTDSQQPNGEYTAMWFPEIEGGDLFKVDDWFEFSDIIPPGTQGTGMQGNKSASLDAFNTTLPDGRIGLKQARYRWMWEKKFNRGLDDDYGSLFAAVKALTEPNPNIYPSQVDSVIETEEWLTAFALRHVLGDWDGYGYNRGKNQFIYRPDGEKIWMLLWDLDFSIGCTGGHGPTQGLFDVANGGFTGSDHMPEIARMYNHPYFRRIYFQALLRIADGPLQDNAYGPTLDARYRALLNNGVAGLTSPYVGSGAQGISLPAWIQQRRTYIYGQVAASTNVAFAVTSPTTVTSSSNLVTITGNAPLGVKTIKINGQEYPVTWTTVTAWSVPVPLSPGTQALSIQPYDRNGNVLPSSGPTVTATFNGVLADPADSIVFNELMFDPAVPNAEYVELYNRSTTTAFDLSGWSVNGLDYTFPTGSFILPRTYLVLVRDAHACISAYGTNTPVFGQYSGNLQGNGETITLVKPGAAPAQDVVVDRVRYESVTPWSTNAGSTGSAIQLIDAQQDNSRSLNWGSRYVPAVWTAATNITGSTNGGWRFVSYTNVTGNASTIQSNLIFLSGAGDVYIDDVRLVDTNNPAVNLLSNGDFEGPFTTSDGGPWTFFGTTGVATNSHIAHDVVHSGSGSLHVVFTGAGGGPGYIAQQLLIPAPTNRHILSYWYYATPEPNNLTVRLRPGTTLISITNVQIVIVPDRYVPPQLVTPAVVTLTPGTANTGASNIVPAIPPLWLNEVQPVNLNGIADNTATREPFIEIYNAGTNAVSLDGFYLSDNYTNLAQWAFPAGATINPGEFKIIFADGQPAQTMPTEWHASFRLDAASTQVALSRTRSGLEILDYLSFGGLRTNWSYGDFPDGQPFYRDAFYRVTPGGTNDNTPPPLEIFINEWMAANAGVITDPADGDFDDWFELFNPGTNVVNLEGVYLTDDLTNKTQFRIPAGYTIPPGGRLLVWADNETGQNSSNRADLHVNFQLSRNGEAIGLFDANGVAISTNTFGLQTDNLSEGRCPDGGNAIAVQSVPTPRTANGCGGGGNTAPVLNPIGHRTVHQGQTVSFVASAIDAEAPPQTLSYSLDAAPPGAGIQLASGLFAWNTTGVPAPSTNAVTVRVTDSASLPFSDSETINIMVLPPPGFGSVTRNGTQVNWSWSSIAGVHYQLLFKQNLGDLNWTPVGEVQTGTGTPLTVTIDTSAGPSGFYRIMVTN